MWDVCLGGLGERRCDPAGPQDGRTNEGRDLVSIPASCVGLGRGRDRGAERTNREVGEQHLSMWVLRDYDGPYGGYG